MLLSSLSERILFLRNHSILYILLGYAQSMPKVSLDMPKELLNDLKLHVGDEKKFISVADAIRSACRKLLDQLDSIDMRQGRIGDE